jgi:hypothetical protein
MSGRRTYQGQYYPINESKYIGDPTKIVYRSSWELLFSKFLDFNSNVKFWSSEEIVIPYYFPLDGKMHRYFPDYWVEFHNGKKVIIEIKPYNETIEPVLKKGGNKRVFADRMATYLKNKAKWEAAKEFCKDRGWEFHVFDEHYLKRLK